MTEREKAAVKNAARDLLTTLKAEKLVLDWRKRQQTRAQVRVAIERILDGGLPEVYTPELYQTKCGIVYQHVYESYHGAGGGVYSSAA